MCVQVIRLIERGWKKTGTSRYSDSEIKTRPMNEGEKDREREREKKGFKKKKKTERYI